MRLDLSQAPGFGNLLTTRYCTNRETFEEQDRELECNGIGL